MFQTTTGIGSIYKQLITETLFYEISLTLSMEQHILDGSAWKQHS